MIIQKTGYPLSISNRLISILTQEIEQHSEVDSSSGCIINFRAPDYSAESGGYHPVEIYLDEQGRFQYITDFAYVGHGHSAELAKELDFDFACGLFQQMGRDYPIRQGAGLFKIWQSNFCDYCQNKVFTVTVQTP
jgi:hypothetical protein